MSRLAPWFYFFTGLTLVGLILPSLLKDGMFMDGQLYATVSKNLAEGYGSMWFPKFSETKFVGLDAFHEHPPLIFWIQSLAFKLLGPSLYTERIYSFSMAIVNALLVIGIWRQIPLQIENSKKWSWLPVLLWITMPIGYWAFTQNLQENTMAVFTTASVLLYVVHLKTSGPKSWLVLISCGFMIFLSSFAKGIPGFFPWAVPAVYWLVFRNRSFGTAVVETLVLIAVPVVCYTVMVVAIPDAQVSLHRYLFERLLVRVSENPTVSTRLMPIVWLLVQWTPAICIFLICWFVAKRAKLWQGRGEDMKWVKFFFLVGLAGSLPIMLTLVQRHFYLTPAFQHFGIAFAIFLVPWFIKFVSSAGPKFERSLKSLVLLLTVIVAYASYDAVGKVGRDHEKLHDVYLILDEIPYGSSLGTDPSISEDWSTKIYMARHGRVTWVHSKEEPYYLHLAGNPIPEGGNFEKVDLELLRFELLKRVD